MKHAEGMTRGLFRKAAVSLPMAGPLPTAARDPWADALTVRHMGDAGEAPGIRIRGDVKLGAPLLSVAGRDNLSAVPYSARANLRGLSYGATQRLRRGRALEFLWRTRPMAEPVKPGG
jgi:hypothetical protein